MNDQTKDLFTLPGVLIDLTIAGIFYVVFALFFMPEYVPFSEPLYLYGFAFFASTPLAAVVWMALGLFRVTLADYRKNPTRSQYQYPDSE